VRDGRGLGFTLIEVLVALAVAAALTGAVAAALFHAGVAGRLTSDAADLSLGLHSMTVVRVLSLTNSTGFCPPSSVSMAREERRAGDGRREELWERWRLVSANRSSHVCDVWVPLSLPAAMPD